MSSGVGAVVNTGRGAGESSSLPQPPKTAAAASSAANPSLRCMFMSEVLHWG